MIKVVHKEPRRSPVSLILLGDDARSILSSVTKFGISATLCPDFEEASQALSNSEYHAVLCDLKIRGAGQFLTRVRKQFPEVAVVVLTHPGDLRSGILATMDGAFGYVQTPLKPQIVASVVQRALASKRLALALQGTSCPS